MNEPTSLRSLNNSPELLYRVFEFLTIKENIDNTSVCSLWRAIASDAVKRKYIALFKESVEQKGANFFSIVPVKLEQICPQFVEIINRRDQLSIKQVRNDLNAIIEKHEVCFAGCFVVNPECQNISQKKRESIAGKAFAQFHFNKPSRVHRSGIDSYWPPYVLQKTRNINTGENKTRTKNKARYYFPIDLFNLKVQGEERVVVGEKDSGQFCFPLRGKIIELTLIPGTQRTIRADCRSTRYGQDRGRDNAPIIDLAAPREMFGIIRERELYISQLDWVPIDNLFHFFFSTPYMMSVRAVAAPGRGKRITKNK